MDVVAVAQRLADETLFPAALETDRSEVVPVELLDALADAGLYGLTGPASAGGLEAEFPSMLAVIEAIDSGCLTTAFVWTQHLGCVRDAAASANEEVRALVPRMCSGELRSGLALGGAHAGRPQLHARPDGGGWVLNGVSPFVSGWGRIDVMHAAARTDDGRLVWSFLDAAEGDTIRAERLDLVALNATATVRLELREHRVPSSMVSSIVPFAEGFTPPPVLRVHSCMPLGVASRCARLLEETSFETELAEVRAELDRLDPATIEAARGRVGLVAWRAAAALVVEQGSRSLLLQGHAQRLAREALFCLVYALRPGSRSSVLALLAGDPTG